MPHLKNLPKWNNERGASAIIVGVFVLLAGLGFAAFAVDFSYRHVVQNELQNAADAAALAGARALYYEDGSQVNYDGGDTYWTESANDIAFDAAQDNYKPDEVAALEVIYDAENNTGDIQRGHWSWGLPGNGGMARGFYPSDATAAVNLSEHTEEELDGMLAFVNAVRVVCRRQASPISTFFGKVFGRDTFPLVQADAVAYRGYTGEAGPGEVDIIIALCLQPILDDQDGDGELDPSETLDCSYGRMLNSSKKVNENNTAGWSDLVQPCGGTASAAALKDILTDCFAGSPYTIELNKGLRTNNGVKDSVFGHGTYDDPSLMNCWRQGLFDLDGNGTPEQPVDADNDGTPEYPWTVRVPIIDCPGGTVGNCHTVVAFATANIVWINRKENKPDQDAPRKMWKPEMDGEPEGWWINNDEDGEDRWNDFVDAFNLLMPDGNPATFENGGFKKKSLYFLPDCTINEPSGPPGGPPTGGLAELPVLVE